VNHLIFCKQYFLSLSKSFWTDGIFQNTRWAKIEGGMPIFDRFAGHKKKILVAKVCVKPNQKWHKTPSKAFFAFPRNFKNTRSFVFQYFLSS